MNNLTSSNVRSIADSEVHTESNSETNTESPWAYPADAEEKFGTDELHNDSGVAIIGITCRFPGAADVDLFWQNLINGVESIAFLDDEELKDLGVHSDALNHPKYVKASSNMPDVALFDASYFGYTPRESEIMDPQHRIFLECANEALEISGYNPETYDGSIGVYTGVGRNNYLFKNIYPNTELVASLSEFDLSISNDKDYVPTRVSYKLNLRGPSVNVNTACSASLVAVHLACQSLLHGECDMMLVGGISIGSLPETGYMYQEGMILSPDGRCRAFDAKAQGTIFGSGVGIVVLKRLSEAVSDGDHIYAVIKGSAINNDGNLKAGYTAPSVEGQAEVISEALAMADVSPETVSYVEAHGTGTVLGDPIEMVALTEAYRELGAETNGFCAIGSLKTNVGHLDSAAGVAGLIKTSLALKHKQIPPSLHFEEPNPKIDFANSPFYVNTELREWPRNGTPRRAGVSSFGIGGTNAHALLEEAPIQQPSGESRPWQLVLLSAKTDTALENATSNLARHLQENPELKLADVAYTLQVGRKALNQRRMLVCQELSDAAALLESRDAQHLLSTEASNDASDTEPSLVFMFSGQGSQYVDMGRELYENEPLFFDQVNHCADLLREVLGVDLSQLLYPEPEGAEDATELLRQTAMAQPALFVVEYALAQLWLSWGVYPQAMIGHSIGEYVAACLAGVFSLEDALQLVSLRGRLMQQMPAGSMLALSLPEAEVLPLLGETLSLAAVNGSSMSVVAGESEVIEAFAQEQEQRGVACRTLHTSHAFHSAMMEPMLTPFLEAVSQVELHAPEIPYISNLTGGWIRDEEATDPAYWVQHVRQAVRFSQGLETMLEALADPKAILLEVGPGRSLSTLARQHPQVGTGELLLSSLRHPQDKQSDVAFLLTSLGRLWLAGVDIDWQGFSEHERRHRLPLPTYPFERRRFWIEPPTDSKGALFNGTYGNGIHSNDTHADRELINGMPERMVLPPRKPDVADWFYVPTWKSTMVSPQEEAQTLLDGTTLFFLDEYGLGEAVAQQLQYQGRGIITVQIGTHFAKLDTQAYMLNPREPGNYIALFDELRRLDDLPDQIVHLWTVTSDQPSDAPLVWAEEMQYRGFYSLLYLSQALGRQNLAATCSLTVVSTNMQEVAGESLLHPEKATILGAVRVIPQEYPTIRCRTVDIILPSQGCIQPGCTGLSGRDFQDNIQVAIQDSSQDNSQDNKRRYREKRLIEQLLSELKTEPFDFTNAVIAYRGNHRWQQTYTPVQLTQPSQGYKNSQEAGQLHSAPFQNRGLVSQVADKENACFGNDRRIDSHLRTGGVYLITGGLGGIGLTLAAHLARHCQPKLILVGRSPLPDRREWNKWLGNHDAEENISRTLREVQKLEELGAEVLLLSGDVANLEQMESIIEQAQEHFGPINGVIHAAGVAGGGIIQHKTHGEAERILAPKVRGTLVLNSVLKDIDLDFWVLCSSTAAIQGIIGQVDYAAANAFLDAFAHYKTAQDGLFTVSINWDTWREVGMAVGTMGDTGVNGGANTGGLSELQKWRSEALQQGIVPAEGADSFERILNGTQPQVVVSPRDFLKLLEYATTFNANAIIDRVEQSQSSALAHPSLAHPRPAMGNPYVAPRNETEETLVTLWQELLGIEQIGIYDNFFELGGHSLLASQLTSRINEKLQTDLSMSILFEEPTVDCLTKYIRKLYQTVKQLQIPSRTLHQEREEITL